MISYKTSDGASISSRKIGESTIVEIDYSKSKEAPSSDKSEVKREVVKKISKQDRVERIKELIAKSLTRTEIKDTMYKESYYLNNPNPASAFAGDWNSI